MSLRKRIDIQTIIWEINKMLKHDTQMYCPFDGTEMRRFPSKSNQKEICKKGHILFVGRSSDEDGLTDVEIIRERDE